MSGEPTSDGAEQLRALLAAPGRDAAPGALPVVALTPSDPPELRAAIEGAAARIVALARRGVEHGEWAELGAPPAPLPPSALRAAWAQRFERAMPIVLPGLVDPEAVSAESSARTRLFEELQQAGGLRGFVDRARPALGPEFTVAGVGPGTSDVERDLERAEVHFARPNSSQRFSDLWVKSAWLSTHDDDRSLRLRLSFGREVQDDASRDLHRHLAVAQLAERLLPECRLAHGHGPLQRLLAEWVGGECFLTQHIAYWNAPGGGALFHHDGFDEPLVGGQRGVVYMQLTGTSAWLALSLADLALRVREFVEGLADGDAPWVREALAPSDAELAELVEACDDDAALADELARPGCGRFGALVNRGPEFTGLLVDAGHAYLLDPGDVIVLPNHGLGATCMHSVLCASDEPGYALSMAIRERRPDAAAAAGPLAVDFGPARTGAGPRRRGGARMTRGPHRRGGGGRPRR